MQVDTPIALKKLHPCHFRTSGPAIIAGMTDHPDPGVIE
jgi:hypothetical protein